MKTIEKEIFWLINCVEHENGHTILGSKASGKATITLPEGFTAPKEFADCYENRYSSLTDEKYSDEQIMLNYLGKKWSQIIENYYNEFPARFFIVDVSSEALALSLINSYDTTLSLLNKKAKAQNIGEIKNLTLARLTAKDEKYETLKVKDKNYKITTKIEKQYSLIKEPENETPASTKPTEKEQ